MTGNDNTSDSADQPTYVTTREATQLADKLASFSGKHAIATRVAMMESQCRLVSRLIRAMLRQVHSSDVFRLEA
jgi:hypothetical protein